MPLYIPTRWGATATYWPRGGKVLVFGGLSINDDQGYLSLSDLWAYDPKGQTWEHLHIPQHTSMVSRFSHAACLLEGSSAGGEEDRLVIYGGDHVSEQGTKTLGDVWILRLGNAGGKAGSRNMRWDPVDYKSLFERSEHGLIAWHGLVYAFGGYAIYERLFNFNMRSFPVVRYAYRDCKYPSLPVSTFIILLLFRPLSPSLVYLPSPVLVGNIDKSAWFEFELPSTPTNRFAHSAVLWRDHLVIFGGVMENGATDLYTLDLNSLSPSYLAYASPDYDYSLAMIISGTSRMIVAILTLVGFSSFILMLTVRRIGDMPVGGRRRFDSEGGMESRRQRRKAAGMKPGMIAVLPLVFYGGGRRKTTEEEAEDGGIIPSLEEGDQSQQARCIEGGRGATATNNTDTDRCDDVCAVCLVDYSRGDCLRILPCLHQYHQECIDPWLARNSLCPCCKQSAAASDEEEEEDDDEEALLSSSNSSSSSRWGRIRRSSSSDDSFYPRVGIREFWYAPTTTTTTRWGFLPRNSGTTAPDIESSLATLRRYGGDAEEGANTQQQDNAGRRLSRAETEMVIAALSMV